MKNCPSSTITYNVHNSLEPWVLVLDREKEEKNEVDVFLFSYNISKPSKT